MFAPVSELACEMFRLQSSKHSGETHISVGERIVQCRLCERGERGSRTIFVFRWKGDDNTGDNVYHLGVEPSKEKIEELVASLRQDGDEQILARIMSEGEPKSKRVAVSS